MSVVTAANQKHKEQTPAVMGNKTFSEKPLDITDRQSGKLMDAQVVLNRPILVGCILCFNVATV
jgi:hypothetical protein